MAASFNGPTSVAFDKDGSLLVVDQDNNRIRRISPSGKVTTYVADSDNHRIRLITPSGNVSTLAGSGPALAFANGVGAAASFYYPYGVAVGSSGTVYVADTYFHRIRLITPSGNVSTLAGSGDAIFADGVGTAASFSQPFGVAVDSKGTSVYVADYGNNRIRMIS